MNVNRQGIHMWDSDTDFRASRKHSPLCGGSTCIFAAPAVCCRSSVQLCGSSAGRRRNRLEDLAKVLPRVALLRSVRCNLARLHLQFFPPHPLLSLPAFDPRLLCTRQRSNLCTRRKTTRLTHHYIDHQRNLSPHQKSESRPESLCQYAKPLKHFNQSTHLQLSPAAEDCELGHQIDR